MITYSAQITATPRLSPDTADQVITLLVVAGVPSLLVSSEDTDESFLDYAVESDAESGSETFVNLVETMLASGHVLDGHLTVADEDGYTSGLVIKDNLLLPYSG